MRILFMFLKGVDNFEIEHRTCLFLVRGVGQAKRKPCFTNVTNPNFQFLQIFFFLIFQNQPFYDQNLKILAKN